MRVGEEEAVVVAVKLAEDARAAAEASAAAERERQAEEAHLSAEREARVRSRMSLPRRMDSFSHLALIR